ncbi:MAG: hypothetical protein NZ902_06190 [Acidilobaceae archaeon]|nr:hypothetical protein [Acidilobaceae archaeon]MCX8166201.1 hypothetical protein [Acidilobaceae archaeon]MDW7974839.1 hypothetical protein [Sulfolobales archaeon]
MPKKEEQKEQKQEGTKTKELKIASVQVVTRDAVMKNQRQMNVLYIIDKLGPMYERTLHELVRQIQEKGMPLGYNFIRVAEGSHSPELKNDLISLTYVGFIETDPIRRKVRTTGDGKEALEKQGAPAGIVKLLEEERDNLKNLTALLDSQIEVQFRRKPERERRSLPRLRDLLR